MLALREQERTEREASRRVALSAAGVRKSFRSTRSGKPVRAVDDVTLEVRRGEIYGLLGANGSGKSTLIRVFSTLLEPDAGRVRVFGLDVRKDELAVQRLINRVSVEASFFKKLSRGMQQKVAIARAFLSTPMLLLLDEPTTGLDIRSKREVQTFVRDLREQHDATIVLTTHDLDEAARLADRIGIIHDGRLVAEGSVEELTARSGARDLEEVFMGLTGRRLEEADKPEEEARP